MVSKLSSRPSASGFDSRMGCAYVLQYEGTWKDMYVAIFFASKPCITVRVRASMPA